jgi:hypothetical protein
MIARRSIPIQSSWQTDASQRPGGLGTFTITVGSFNIAGLLTMYHFKLQYSTFFEALYQSTVSRFSNPRNIFITVFGSLDKQTCSSVRPEACRDVVRFMSRHTRCEG